MVLAHGYSVQTLRIVTQPFGELVAGRSDTEALALLKTLDDLAAAEGFAVNVGQPCSATRTNRTPCVCSLEDSRRSTMSRGRRSSPMRTASIRR
jgi:hypothetical protein